MSRPHFRPNAQQNCLNKNCRAKIPLVGDFTDLFCAECWSRVPTPLKRKVWDGAKLCRRAGRALDVWKDAVIEAKRAVLGEVGHA